MEGTVMANPTRYDFDDDIYVYDPETDTIRSRDGREEYDGDGNKQ